MDFISPESNTPQIGQVWKYPQFIYSGNSRTMNCVVELEILCVDEGKVGVLPIGILPAGKTLVEYIPLEEFKSKAYKRVK